MKFASYGSTAICRINDSLFFFDGADNHPYNFDKAIPLCNPVLKSQEFRDGITVERQTGVFEFGQQPTIREEHGSKECNKSLKHLTSYSSEEGIFLWCLGNNDVGVLKLDTLEYEVVENFTENESTGDLPLSL